MKHTGIGAALMLLVAACAPAHAQLSALFKSANAARPDVDPHGWSDSAYLPPTLDGAVHIRVGSGGRLRTDDVGAVGMPNCDIAYLYSAKSGIALTPAEVAHCALLEFGIKRRVERDRRNPSDSFVRQDIINEMSPWIEQRIARFRSADKFYFRAVGYRFGAFDMATQNAPVSINFEGFETSGVRYRFQGQGFLNPQVNWMTVAIGGDEATMRDIEGARMRSGGARMALQDNQVRFTVTGTEQKLVVSTLQRWINVQHEEMSFRYYDSQQRLHTITM